MNTERLEHLLRQYFDAEIAEPEIAELELALQTRPEVRERFWKEAHLQSALRDWGLEEQGARELHLLRPAATPKVPRKDGSRATSWHPLASAAAGVAFGLLCASVAWAVNTPRHPTPRTHSIPIGDPGFEAQTGPLPTGFPSGFGVWSGDPSRCTLNPSVKTPEGKQLLEFVQADREPTLPNWGAHSCDVYQLVDLRPLKQEAGGGETCLELSARFLDVRAAPGERISFRCRLHVFAGLPETIAAQWPLSEKDALASGAGITESFGGANNTGHRLQTKILLPPQADFALIQLVAHMPTNPAGTVAEFGSQYADDVQLTLHTQPNTSQRLSRR
jgi:hypothetical protein